MTSKKTEMTLYEKVDFGILDKLLAVPDGEMSGQIKRQLDSYASKKQKKTGQIPVTYSFGEKTPGVGRLYAKEGLSLQAIEKSIRHALAKDIYMDLDMVNSQPRLILQFCEKAKPPIPCKHLEYYVNNREKILTQIQKHHKITRDQAKKLMLTLMCLGGYTICAKGEHGEEVYYKPKEKELTALLEFKSEAVKIAEAVCDLEPDLLDMIKKDHEKPNKKSSVLSTKAQTLENMCLMEMYKYFTERNFTVGVLCFDGLMVEKTEKLEKSINQILRDCEKQVLEKVGYGIKLEVKPMNLELKFKLPEFSIYVEDDEDCCEKLIRLEGSEKFKFCKGGSYIFNEKTGVYDTSIETFYQYLIKHKAILKVKDGTRSYGGQASLMKSAAAIMGAKVQDDTWLERTDDSSIGYLLFNNGIYDMRTSIFTKGFNPNIVFHVRIPHDFPERNEEKIAYAKKLSFDACFTDPKPVIYALAKALSGNADKKFYMCPGKSNSGKSCLKKMLSLAFGELIGDFNAESLASSSAHDTKDEAAKIRWALLVRHTRILVSNEMNMQRSLDGNAMKKHSSGGDTLLGRINHKDELKFTPHYTIFCMVNDHPKIEPMDNALLGRLEYIEFPFVFTSETDAARMRENEKPQDPDLKFKIKSQDFIDGFIHILLDAYKDYLINGMPTFDKTVKDKWTADGKQSSEIVELIKTHYVVTRKRDDTILISDMNNFKKEHRQVFATISAPRFKEIMETELGVTEKRTSSRFWVGIRPKTEADIRVEEEQRTG